MFPNGIQRHEIASHKETMTHMVASDGRRVYRIGTQARRFVTVRTLSQMERGVPQGWESV